MTFKYLFALTIASVLAGSAIVVSAQSPKSGAATAADARAFLADVNRDLLRLINDGNRAS